MFNNKSQAEFAVNTERDRLIAQLAAAPDTLVRIIGDRTNKSLRQPGQDGSVAVVEILGNLQDWEEITGERLWRLLHEENPDLESWDDTLWNIEHDYASRNAHDVVEAFAIARKKLVETLSGLDDAGWQRTADLQNDGPVAVLSLMERVAAHDEKHIAEIGETLR